MVYDPAGKRPRVRPPAHLPRRRPARPRLRPPYRPAGRAVRPERGGARRGAAGAAFTRSGLVAGTPRKGAQATRGRAARLHLLQSSSPPPVRRDDNGGPGRRGPGGSAGLPLDAGRGDVEGRTARRWHGRRPHRRGLGLVAHQPGPFPRLRPAPDQGEGRPHCIRCRAAGHRRAAPRRNGGAGEGPPGPRRRRLPPLRPSRRGGVQGQQGAVGSGPQRLSPPDRSRTLRRPQRPRSPRGGGHVAPAGRARRDPPRGAVGGEGAHPVDAWSEGRRSGGRHDRGQAQGDPLPRRPAQASPPLRGQDPHGQVHPHAPPHRHTR